MYKKILSLLLVSFAIVATSIAAPDFKITNNTKSVITVKLYDDTGNTLLNKQVWFTKNRTASASIPLANYGVLYLTLTKMEQGQPMDFRFRLDVRAPQVGEELPSKRQRAVKFIDLVIEAQDIDLIVKPNPKATNIYGNITNTDIEDMQYSINF